MKKENNIEVTQTLRFETLGTYDIDDGFFADIVFDAVEQPYKGKRGISENYASSDYTVDFPHSDYGYGVWLSSPE